MKKVQKSIPVYDICSLSDAGTRDNDIIAQPFAAYLAVHPNLHAPHRHTFYHVVLFTKGNGYHTIEFEQFPVKEGQIYFMIPGQVHSWNFEGEVDGFIINFSDELLSSFLSDKDYSSQFHFLRGVAKESVIQLPPIATGAVKKLFEQVIDEVINANGNKKDMICVYLISLFIAVSRNSPSLHAGNVPLQNQLVLFNFRKLVNIYYAEKRLPKDYAAMLYVTPNHLNALCNDLLGQQAGELIRERVLLEAKRLLVNMDVNIAEIAYRLNFTDNSYFTKFFKKYTGVTPEDFRKTTGVAIKQ